MRVRRGLRRAAFGPGRRQEAGSRAPPAGPRSRCAGARSQAPARRPGGHWPGGWSRVTRRRARGSPPLRMAAPRPPRALAGGGPPGRWCGREPCCRRDSRRACGWRGEGPAKACPAQGFRRDLLPEGEGRTGAAGPGCASTWSHAFLVQAPGEVVRALQSPRLGTPLSGAW